MDALQGHWLVDLKREPDRLVIESPIEWSPGGLHTLRLEGDHEGVAIFVTVRCCSPVEHTHVCELEPFAPAPEISATLRSLAEQLLKHQGARAAKVANDPAGSGITLGRAQTPGEDDRSSVDPFVAGT